MQRRRFLKVINRCSYRFLIPRLQRHVRNNQVVGLRFRRPNRTNTGWGPQWGFRLQGPAFIWNTHFFWFEQDWWLNGGIFFRWLWSYDSIKYTCLGIYYSCLVALLWQL